MQITFYNSTKKANSTAIPNNGQVVEGEFKRGFSLLAPGVEIVADWTLAPSWNYCYVPAFKRYYWVSGWSYYGGIWSCQLSVDPLASHRTAIGQQRLFINRSSAAYNGNVVDTLYTTTAARADFRAQSENNRPFGEYSTGSDYGMYCFGVIGSGQSGSVRYYIMSEIAANNFISTMMNTIDWANISANEISKELQKALVNPMQYIVSCRWYPYAYSRFRSDLGGLPQVYSIKVGYWSMAVPNGCVPVYSNSQISRTKSITIPKHPQAATRGNYLNLSPWSSYHLSFWPFGDITLDSTDLSGYSTIECDYYINLATGDGTLYVSTNGKANAVRILHANWGVDIPVGQVIAQIPSNALNVGTAAAGLGITALTKYDDAVSEAAETSANFIYRSVESVGKAYQWVKGKLRGDDTSGIFSDYSASDRASSGIAEDVKRIIGKTAAIGDAAASSMLHAETIGNQGNMAYYQFCPIALCAKFLEISPEDNAHNGRPLLDFRVISTIPGYIQCRNADITVEATAEERDMIKQHLLGGFFFE